MMMDEARRQTRLLFTGDIRLYDAYEGSLLDGALTALAEACDVRCCNFEGVVPFANAASDKKAGPTVMQGKNAAERVRASGFNLVTLANNHSMDYGVDGLSATLAAFTGVPVIGAGLTAQDAYKPYVTECNGVKLGFLALSERQYGTLDGSLCAGTAWIYAPQALNNIRLLKAECTHVIVVCHAGLEDVSEPLPEWRALYRQFIDAGATAVVAHHPHVPQGWERYKNGVIFYSLGNCAWEPVDEFDSQRSLVATVTLDNHRLVDFAVQPVVYADGSLQADDSAETAAYLAEINRVLDDPAAYEKAIERICHSFYEEIALPDFYTITGALPGNAWQQLKNACKLLLRRRTLNKPLLRSMIDNESYRYAVSRALREETEHA